MKSYTDFQQLSTQELLAIALREKPDSTTINELCQMLKDPQVFMVSETCSPNLRKSKELQVKAGMELGRRLYTSPSCKRPLIKSAEDAANLLQPELRYLDREYFKVLLLNRKLYLLGTETVSIGGLSSNIVHPRECFLAAIRRSAASIILAHNHPSGDPTPSTEDIELTKRMKEAGKVLGIDVLDHIIIGDGKWISLNNLGIG